jgi:DNA-binding NarL/FixJ family response regulator
VLLPLQFDRFDMHRSRVLLVDDNPEFLEIAATLLEGHDYDVVGRALDGDAGLKAALGLNPDVVVLDISMPNLNGFEVARRLRHHQHRAAVVLLTFHEDVEFVRAARAIGVRGYVIKRRMASDLPAAVAEVLAGRTFVSPPLELDDEPQ